MNNAEIMREKQRRADLKKQGIDPDADVEKPKKEYDASFMDKYAFDYGDEDGQDGEEEKKEDDDDVGKSAAASQSAASQSAAADQGKGKGKKNKKGK